MFGADDANATDKVQELQPPPKKKRRTQVRDSEEPLSPFKAQLFEEHRDTPPAFTTTSTTTLISPPVNSTSFTAWFGLSYRIGVWRL